ncbi:MAG TPA: c-type cytochrome [Vicinamibacterales bacterium]|nr:c-type cytochrome [Vicinamibacterales bacterium]
MRMLMTAAALLAGAILTTAASEPPQLFRTFTNLQVFPRTIASAELITAMKGFTSALGVRCEGCHVGEGNDLSKFDFASDAVPAKVIARRMLQMTSAINDDLLKGVGDAGRQPKVTCFTCHRGTRTPLTAPAGSGL